MTELLQRAINIITALPDRQQNAITAQILQLLTPPQPQAVPKKLSKVLAGRVGRVSFAPSNLSENTSQAFTELLRQKHSHPHPTNDPV
ncbi:MAG: hypothetical protein AAGA67_03255 [Cyanobacteria bacterium P01_F01_bin.153]